MKSIRRLLVCGVLLCSVNFASAAVLISDFSDIGTQAFPPFNGNWTFAGTDQFVQNVGNISITSVSGGNPFADGSFDAVIAGSPPIDFTTYNALSLTALVNAGNFSSSVRVQVFDSAFDSIGYASFSASGFTGSFSTQTAAFIPFGIGNITDATFWSLTGDGIAANAFRFSFDDLTATTTVPEPSTYALMAVGLGVLLVVSRRKKVAVRA